MKTILKILSLLSVLTFMVLTSCDSGSSPLNEPHYTITLECPQGIPDSVEAATSSYIEKDYMGVPQQILKRMVGHSGIGDTMEVIFYIKLDSTPLPKDFYENRKEDLEKKVADIAANMDKDPVKCSVTIDPNP